MATAGYPTPWFAGGPAAGQVYKFIVFINGPNCGFSETWYVNPSPALSNNPAGPGDQMDKIAQGYYDSRGDGLTPDFSMVAYRYTDVTIPRAGELRVPPAWPIAGKPVTGESSAYNASSLASVGAQLRITDGTGSVRRNEIFCGIPDGWYSNTLAQPNKLKTADGSFKNFVNFIKSWEVNLSASATNKLGTAGLKYFVKDPAVNQPAVIQTLTATGPNNFITVTVAPVTPTDWVANVKPGDQLVIGGIRAKCATKTNGKATVVSSTFNSANSLYTIVFCKPFCCMGVPTVCPSKGKLYRPIYNYAPATTVTPRKAASKKVGRPFDLSRGRRPAGCR
jgi:hypothetical protein